MKGYHAGIEKLTTANNAFRQVVYTGRHTQLVLMSIGVGEEVGSETHTDTDQFFRIESGEGKAIIDGNEYLLTDGDALIVPAGVVHNIINTSQSIELKLYTLYSPPHHRDKTVHKTKIDAINDSEHFDGVTTE